MGLRPPCQYQADSKQSRSTRDLSPNRGEKANRVSNAELRRMLQALLQALLEGWYSASTRNTSPQSEEKPAANVNASHVLNVAERHVQTVPTELPGIR